MTIGERIKNRRKELGMSAEDVAAIIGTSPATIYRYESNYITKMGVDKLTPIADALRVSEAYLMGWTSNPDWQPEPEAPAGIAGDEQVLLGFYRELNDEGKEKLVDYADDLCSSGKYKKHCADAVV